MVNCIKCGEEFSPRRFSLGYRTCLDCGEKQAVNRKNCVVPLNKSNYILVTSEETLTQLNPKR